MPVMSAPNQRQPSLMSLPQQLVMDGRLTAVFKQVGA